MNYNKEKDIKGLSTQASSSLNNQNSRQLANLNTINFTADDYETIYDENPFKTDVNKLVLRSSQLFALASTILLEDLTSGVFKAEHLQSAISNTCYCFGPGSDFMTNDSNVDGTNYHAFTPYATMFLYNIYRFAKSLPRRAQNQTVTDENYKQVLLDILNDFGNENKKSYKWDILRAIARMVSHVHSRSVNNDQECAKGKLLYKLATHGIFFDDNDVQGLINNIKIQLTQKLSSQKNLTL